MRQLRTCGKDEPSACGRGDGAPFQFTPQATEDLDAIWWFISEHSRDAADRVEWEIVAA
jgi:hypothetical protein